MFTRFNTLVLLPLVGALLFVTSSESQAQLGDIRVRGDVDANARVRTRDADDRSRYRRHNGYWWYQTDNDGWLYYNNGRWYNSNDRVYSRSSARADVHVRADDRSPYRWHNGYWWYETDDGGWLYYDNGSWYNRDGSAYGRSRTRIEGGTDVYIDDGVRGRIDTGVRSRSDLRGNWDGGNSGFRGNSGFGGGINLRGGIFGR